MIISRRLRWVGYVARMEESRSAFRKLTGKYAGKTPWRRWILKKYTRNWVDSAQNRDFWRIFVDSAFNLRVY